MALPMPVAIPAKTVNPSAIQTSCMSATPSVSHYISRSPFLPILFCIGLRAVGEKEPARIAIRTEQQEERPHLILKHRAGKLCLLHRCRPVSAIGEGF
ncbi:MAG: hypothetical protein JXL84_11180, partial [Deltaproteobacteria bacterium]|nr:hypothetical protein [Deltaproteobacteria bacterium]